MASTENSAPPLGFPDVSLSVPYLDALHYAQARLKMIGRGGLKPFCETHELPYTTVVNLKNGNVKHEEPRLLQRILRSVDVATELIRVPVNSKSQRFLFPHKEALTTFQTQLASLQLPPAP